MKHKMYVEPEREILPQLGSHLFLMLGNEALSARRQNVHLTGSTGDTGKTTIMSWLIGVFRVAGSKHIINQISNCRFGADQVQESFLYKICFLNDITVATLSGGELKSLFESDGSAIQVKGSSVEAGAKHVPCFITSNLPDTDSYRKAARETGSATTMTSMDFTKLFDLTEGRVGAHIVTEAQVPKIWQRNHETCRHCSAKIIKWTVQNFLHRRTYCEPEEFYQDSDCSTDGETQTVNDTMPKMRVLKIGMRKKRSKGTQKEADKTMRWLTDEQLQALEDMEEAFCQPNKPTGESGTARTAAVPVKRTKNHVERTHTPEVNVHPLVSAATDCDIDKLDFPSVTPDILHCNLTDEPVESLFQFDPQQEQASSSSHSVNRSSSCDSSYAVSSSNPSTLTHNFAQNPYSIKKFSLDSGSGANPYSASAPSSSNRTSHRNSHNFAQALSTSSKHSLTFSSDIEAASEKVVNHIKENSIPSSNCPDLV